MILGAGAFVLRYAQLCDESFKKIARGWLEINKIDYDGVKIVNISIIEQLSGIHGFVYNDRRFQTKCLVFGAKSFYC